MNSPHVNAWLPSPPQLQQGRLQIDLQNGELQRPGRRSISPGRQISPGPHARELLQRSISPGPQASAPGMPVFQPPFPASPWGNSPPGVWPAVALGTPPARMRAPLMGQGPIGIPPLLNCPGQFIASPAPMNSPSPSKLRARSPSQVVVPVSPVAPNGRIPNGMPNGIFPQLGNVLAEAERDLAEGMELIRGDMTGCLAIDWLDRKLTALSERQADRAEQQAYLTQLRCLAAEGSAVSSPDNLGRSSGSGGMISLLQADHEALRHQVDQLRRQRFETERERDELNRAHEREREELVSARASLEADIEGKLKEIKSLSDGVEDGVRKTRGIEDVAAGKIGELEQRCQALKQELEAERQISTEAIRERMEAQRLQQDAEADLTAVKEISGKVLHDCRSLQKRVMDLQSGHEEKADMNDYRKPERQTSNSSQRPSERRSRDEPQQLVSDALMQQKRVSALRQELAAEEAAAMPLSIYDRDVTMHDRIKDLEREMAKVHNNVRKSKAPIVDVQSRRSSMPQSPTLSFPAREQIRSSMPASVCDFQHSISFGSQRIGNPHDVGALAPLTDWAKDYPAIAPLEE